MLLAVTAGSQNVSAIIERDKILIGEQVNLILKTENVTGIAQWFAMPDTVNHIEVVNRSKIDTIQVVDKLIFQQTITITSFDSGTWQIPALTIQTEDNNQLATTPLTLEVLPVDVSQMQEYNDIKEIIEVETTANKTILLIIVAITLISLAFLYWFIKRGKKQKVKAPLLAANLAPVDWALQQLTNLQQQQLTHHNQVKDHYLQLTNILRQYFYLQLNQQSLHQTTDEWMVSLHTLPIGADGKISFLQLLRLADTVKFAKYLPPPAENDQSVETAKKMVLQVAGLQYAGIPSFKNKS